MSIVSSLPHKVFYYNTVTCAEGLHFSAFQNPKPPSIRFCLRLMLYKHIWHNSEKNEIWLMV